MPIRRRFGRRRRPPRDASEAFKPRGDEAFHVSHTSRLVLDQNEETLAPAVVVATVALIAVFVLGFLFQIVGFVI
ncbi:hypothetical protein DJ82_03575 [Halorubrum sp. Ib24]|nr:hypothetical protein DJ82_03575 [Halorubrum sp. Ib24]